MKSSMTAVAVLAAAVWSVAAGAQSGGTMPKADKMDTIQMMETSYTGCIEAGSAADTFTLTHPVAAGRMSSESMKADSPAALILSGSPVDLRKHVGHKVTVSGSLAHEKKNAMGEGRMDAAAPTFTVKSLKMIAASCS